ncbi:MAG: hypothetical protein A2X48_04525 [Lentisphaerae bacterium GWF2_49_21]|nr:MAG: hypothetical protein A2X48_04525 [Lentisphaerae bacterium GWF2_49_21]
MITDKILIIKPIYEAWPVGYAYVLACLEYNGIPFDFIDSNRTYDWEREVVYKMKKRKYFMVAMGGLIGFYKVFKTVANLTHKYNTGTPFILGGNIVKDSNDRLLFEEIGIDYGLLGEAETSLPYFIKTYKSDNKDFSEVSGLVYRNNTGKVVRNTAKRLDLQSMNVLPAWHYFDTEYYIKSSSSPFIGNNLRFMPILSGRGCVGQCGFCSPSIGGFRKRKIEDVISELEKLMADYEFDCFLFYNEMFYPTSSEIKEFCIRYKSIKNKKPWITQVRIDANIDIDTFKEMKEAGCIIVSAGIESGSDRILERMKKKTTSEQIRKFFRNARIAKIPANGTFIVGYEDETEEDLKKTIDLVIDEEINTGASLLYVYPGTALYKTAHKNGAIKDEMEFLEKAMSNMTALFSPGGKEDYFNISAMPDKDFFKIVTREVRRYYTFIFNRYPVDELSSQIEIINTSAIIYMKGKCHECRMGVSYNYKIVDGRQYLGFLGDGINDRLICPKCFTPLSFNIYKCNNDWELPKYLSLLTEQVKEKKRIVIAGINQDLNFILRINLLNNDNLIGIMRTDNNYNAAFYNNYPVLSAEEAIVLKPDLILWLDIISEPQDIINKYNRYNISPPAIICLSGEQLNKCIKDVRNKIIQRGGPVLLMPILRQYLERKYLFFANACKKNNIEIPRFITGYAKYIKHKILSIK